jgi:hypothetical protein
MNDQSYHGHPVRVGVQFPPPPCRYDELRRAVAVVREPGADAILNRDHFTAPLVEHTCRPGIARAR